MARSIATSQRRSRPGGNRQREKGSSPLGMADVNLRAATTEKGARRAADAEAGLGGLLWTKPDSAAIGDTERAPAQGAHGAT